MIKSHFCRCVDASSVDIIRTFGAQRYLDLLAPLHPRWLFANEDEHAALAPLIGALAVSTTVIVKQGPEPVLLLGASAGEPVAVPPVDGVRDTTGAGDAFAAGFLAGRCRGQDVRSCVQSGIELAARVLANPGASL